jgi:uncharacterized protein DUF7010
MGTKPDGRLSGAQLGSLIGAIAGLLFILVNAGGTGAGGPIRAGGVVLFLAALWWGVARVPPSAPASLSERAGRIYWLSVGAEVVSIPLGAAVINNVLDRPELTVLWVVAVVGVHFLPFSQAFGARMYAWLGTAMILLALAGAIVTVAAGSDSAPSWFAVMAGVVLLGFCVAGPRLAAAAPTSAHP